MTTKTFLMSAASIMDDLWIGNERGANNQFALMCQLFETADDTDIDWDTGYPKLIRDGAKELGYDIVVTKNVTTGMVLHSFVKREVGGITRCPD